MEIKILFNEYKKYFKIRIRKLIIYGIIGFYLLFLYFYNLKRNFGFDIQSSWLYGIIPALVTTLIFILMFNILGFVVNTDLTTKKMNYKLYMILIGTIMLLFAGIIGINNSNILSLLPITPIVLLSFLMPLILGIFSYLGIIMILFEKKYGYYTILLTGLIAAIGMFIPIFQDLNNLIPLVLTLLYIDPFFIIIGSILGLFLKD